VFKTNEELLAIKNLGQTVLTEIDRKLSDLDLNIGMNAEEFAVPAGEENE
jgi:DNA-directed RNA polymerase alpha subunit